MRKCINVDGYITKKHIIEAMEKFGLVEEDIVSPTFTSILSGEYRESACHWHYIGIIEGTLSAAGRQEVFDIEEDSTLERKIIQLYLSEYDDT